MKILIVTDAWLPQTNGVVRTLQAMVRELEKAGHEVQLIGPDPKSWSSFLLPTYSEVTLEFFSRSRLRQLLDAFAPDAIHLATEGPLGWTMRQLCLKRGLRFSTAYHTRFPEYFGARVPFFLRPIVEGIAYSVLRHFHAPSMAVMAPTKSMHDTLVAHGFAHLAHWSRGVDTNLFTSERNGNAFFHDWPRPILLSVGRVSIEKNLRAFLDLKTEGTKVVVGSGPDQKKLAAHYPDVRFMGRLEKEKLVQAYAGADLFVFSSKTDTFGLVLLEACAAGLRVAAYPVAGPKDVLRGAEAQAFTVLDEDLQKAVDTALTLPDTRILPRAFAEKHSWAVSAAQFYHNLWGARPKPKAKEGTEGVDVLP